MIYVDSYPIKFKNQNYYHLLSDNIYNIEELHEFAQNIGLKKEWFQNKIGDTPHYDISENKRKEAIKKGASILLDKKDIIKIIRLWRNK